MVSGASFPRRLSWLALLCACAVVLAWAAPLLTDVLHSSRADWPLDSSQTVTDPIDTHAHVWEMADDPLILASIGVTAIHRLIFSIPPVQPSAWAWFPLPPARPPILLHAV